jgi:hypothetical protein
MGSCICCLWFVRQARRPPKPMLTLTGRFSQFGGLFRGLASPAARSQHAANAAAGQRPRPHEPATGAEHSPSKQLQRNSKSRADHFKQSRRRCVTSCGMLCLCSHQCTCCPTCCVCHTEVCIDYLHARASAVQHIADGHLAVKHTGGEYTRNGGTPLRANKAQHGIAQYRHHPETTAAGCRLLSW